MSGAFESTLLSRPRSTNKLFMETGFGVNAGFERYRNSEYAVSDGATTLRAAGIYGPFDAVNNVRGWIAGVATLTIVARFPVFATATCEVVAFQSVTNNTPGSVDRTITLRLQNGTELRVLQNRSTGNRQFTYAGFGAAYSGKTVFVEAQINKGTADPVIRIDGVNVSSSFVASTTGTPIEWLSDELTPTYQLTGLNWPAGVAPEVTPILGTLSDADRAFWLSTGKPPAWVVAGGSMSASITNSFDSESTGWSVANSGTITNNVGFVQFYSPANDLRVQRPNAIPLGTKVLISFEARAPSTATSMDVATYFNTGTSVTLTGSWDSYTVELGSGTNQIPTTLILRVNGDGLVQMRNLSIKPLGALSLPSVQPINVINDVSGIGTNCGRILGAATTATSNKKVWRIADLTKTSGNEQLLGGAVFVGTSQDYIKSWTIVNAGGTTTVSLGDVSGGAQYLSGLSVPTGTTVVTLLTNTPLTTNLWCNASTTASLTHVIEGYRTV